MTKLTIFSAPKPFTQPHIDLIQRNAIQSWLHLGDEVEVILIGDEEGMAEVAAEYGIRHFPQVACNQEGTPLISSIFDIARQNSGSPLLAYVNADILLMPDFVEMALKTAEQAEKFLLVGQRWDLDVTTQLEFTKGWNKRLRVDAVSRGRLHVPAGSDYFIYPRTVFEEIPEFAVGRAGWDNWMIYHAVTQPWPVIDATRSIMIVHQNHDYAHLPQGQMHYDLEETQRNVILAGGESKMYMLLDSNKELVGGRIRPPRFRLVRLVRSLERALLPGIANREGWRWRLTRRLRKIRRDFVE